MAESAWLPLRLFWNPSHSRLLADHCLPCHILFCNFGIPPWSHLQITLFDGHFYRRLTSQYKSYRWTSALAESLQCKRHWTPPYQPPGPNLNLFSWIYNSWNHKMLNNTKRIERTFSEEGMLVRFLKTFHVHSSSVVTKVYSIHPLENKLSRISRPSLTPQLC